MAQQAQAQQNALGVANLTGYYNAPTGPGYSGGLASSTGAWTPPTQEQYTQARIAQLVGTGMPAVQAQQTATAEWGQGFAQSGNVAYGMPPGISFTPPAAPAAGGVTVNGAPVGQGVQTLAGQQQAFSQNMANSQQGLDYLKYASSLGGPADVFNQADFLRGANARGDVPTFLSALGSNTQLPTFQGAGSMAQTPMTAGGMASSLTGGAGTTSTGYSTDQALNQIGSIFKQGPTQLAQGSIEKLSPAELAIFQAGGTKLGYDPTAWLKAYGASGAGQTTGQLRA
jgi:hypothetical protein